MWIIEDCFITAGVSLAATALAVTDRLRVGLGILPAVARNPAVTAMELATLAELAPGRLMAGIGHGVQPWMAQMGARTPSPLTTLEEVLVTLRRLLAGERVSMHGSFVRLDDVALDRPPARPPPLYAGVRGPRSLALAGRVADGILIAEPAAPAVIAGAIDQAGRPQAMRVAAYACLCVEDDGADARRIMAPWLHGLLADPTATAALGALPCYDELAEVDRAHGVDGLAALPASRWRQIGPVGTIDDALAHVGMLEDAGVDQLALFPAPDVGTARKQLGDVARIARR